MSCLFGGVELVPETGRELVAFSDLTIQGLYCIYIYIHIYIYIQSSYHRCSGASAYVRNESQRLKSNVSTLMRVYIICMLFT